MPRRFLSPAPLARRPLQTAVTHREPAPEEEGPAGGGQSAEGPDIGEEATESSRVEGGPLLYTADQAAARLRVPASWLRKKAAAQQIPHTRLGRHLRFAETDLALLLEDGARGPRP
ncbi:helix-turn-helix domain-containing protein [Streptomyces smyrnaeus]|uniref:helix-turn-helix domain-containing protein n=1 Tax=Streptomyces smyrnaeus TaxID=1387713 RepID=UPI0036760665